ncbi:unnamed protein product [Ixodes pacificus]
MLSEASEHGHPSRWLVEAHVLHYDSRSCGSRLSCARRTEASKRHDCEHQRILEPRVLRAAARRQEAQPVISAAALVPRELLLPTAFLGKSAVDEKMVKHAVIGQECRRADIT